MKLILLILVVLSCLSFPAQSQSNPHYTATDPAVRDMLISLDMPRYTGSVPAANIAGNWQLVLDDGIYLDLALLQSGSSTFGRGNVSSGIFSQWAFASGSISGTSLDLDIVPESGLQLYAVSIDISRLPFAGTYVLFAANAAPKPGVLQATKSM